MTPLQKKLIGKGYKKDVSDLNRTMKMTDTMFWKSVSDQNGKKYFIDIYYSPESKCGHTSLPETIQAEAYFGNGIYATGEPITVKLSTKDIDKIEAEFEKIWSALGIGYSSQG
jgi:hypothetical protein